ncbi:hypothetical protein C0995_012841 [Termitomyces sp. Mi166|nr:hypothetical protein C0995_012841 [Termitomyces sp. Mi166\
MQNPKREIEDVISQLITTKNPKEQKKAITRYFAENASFQSPVYKIPPHQQSREDALGVYQWLRMISPATYFKATNIVFDEASEILMVEGNITFHFLFSLTQPKPAKVLIHMKLKKNNKEYVITSQEFFYHPDQLANTFLPFISPLVGLGLSTFAYASAVSAKLAQVIGIWRVNDDNDGKSDDGKGNNASTTNANARSSHGHENRRNSSGSHSSEETKIGTNESHSGSERQGSGEGHSAKKHRKRRDASGHHTAVHS